MSRIRTVKPEFWTSGQVLECSHSARLLFIGLWNFCDDGGVHPAHIRQIKAEIFPGDDVSIAQVQGWVDELIRHRLVVRFSADYQGEAHTFFYVTGWAHQRIDKPSLKYPQYQEVPDSTIIPRSFDDHSENEPRSFDDHSATGVEWKGEERKGVEWKGVEEEAQPEPAAATPPAVVEPPPSTPPSAFVESITLTPAQTAQTPKAAKPAKPKGPPMPECPECLDSAVWQRFVDYRIAKKKPLTPEAASITLNRLVKAQEFGWHPETLIDDAIANGWQGCVYSDKHFQPVITDRSPPAQHNGQSRPITKHDRLIDRNKQAMDAWVASHNANVIEGECHEIH